MNDIVLSICVPTYKRGNFVKELVENILCNSDEKRIEVLVMDDCSPDNTQELLSGINDTRLNYCRNEENYGAAYNTHLCFLNAKGKFAYLTSDEDDIDVNKLYSLITRLEENPDLAVMILSGTLKYSNKHFKDAVYTKAIDALENLAFKTRYMTGIIFNTELYKKYIGYIPRSEAPDIWDSYSFMYAMAKLFCYGKTITSSELYYNQNRFELTCDNNNARVDGVLYYEPQGRINQLTTWINAIYEFPLSDDDKLFMILKVTKDMLELANKMYTDSYKNDVKNTAPIGGYHKFLDELDKHPLHDFKRHMFEDVCLLSCEKFFNKKIMNNMSNKQREVYEDCEKLCL